MELHIWGPAIGLPTIDAECLSAIAILCRARPVQQWKLVASFPRPDSAPTSLPALYSEGKWHYGLTTIYNHLLKAPLTLTPSQSTDLTAYTFHVQLTLSPLVQQTLFFSDTNYPILRRAYTSLLPFPTAYFIPPRLRSLALASCSHLNAPISTAPLPDATTQRMQEQAQAAIPAHLRSRDGNKGRTAKEREDAARRIRFDDAMIRALEPLEELLNPEATNTNSKTNKEERAAKWMLGTPEPTLLDFVVFGYLATLLHAEMPERWGMQAIMREFKGIIAFMESMMDWKDMQDWTDEFRWKEAEQIGIVERMGLTAVLAREALVPDGWAPGPEIVDRDQIDVMSIEGQNEVPTLAPVLAKAGAAVALVAGLSAGYVKFLE